MKERKERKKTYKRNSFSSEIEIECIEDRYVCDDQAEIMHEIERERKLV